MVQLRIILDSILLHCRLHDFLIWCQTVGTVSSTYIEWINKIPFPLFSNFQSFSISRWIIYIHRNIVKFMYSDVVVFLILNFSLWCSCLKRVHCLSKIRIQAVLDNLSWNFWIFLLAFILFRFQQNIRSPSMVQR